MDTKESRAKERRLKHLERRLKNLKEAEANARTAWTKEYKRFMTYSAELAEREERNMKKGTKRGQQLVDYIKNWPERSEKLTKIRDELRTKIDQVEDELAGISLELKKLQLEWDNDLQANDDLIEVIFQLNQKIVQALEERNAVLTKRVYSRLIKEDGTLRRQLTLENSDGTRKLVALVNSIQFIQTELAEAAKAEIEKFFERYQQPILPQNPTLAKLYQLTQELLVDKRNFKIGPSFYIFISLDIDAAQFPELAKAQENLRASIRSMKTNSYIRLYERASRSDKWIPIKQS